MFPTSEDFVNCPYNPIHRIRPDAMQKHLFKCRRNHRSIKLLTCPFNTVHHVPAPELNLHIAECPDRATFELYKYCIADGSRGSSQDPELIYNDEPPRSISPESGFHESGAGQSLQDDDECWDDSAVPAYNPHAYCKSANVIRKATNMKKSQKREFYRAERERLNGWRRSDVRSSSEDSDDGGKKTKETTNTLVGADEWWDDEVVPMSKTIPVKTKEDQRERRDRSAKQSDQQLKEDLEGVSLTFAQKLKMNQKLK